jgi:hypothetical protein
MSILRCALCAAPAEFALLCVRGFEELKFAKRYDTQVCLDRVRWPSQSRDSDMPGAIQTNSSGRRRG